MRHSPNSSSESRLEVLHTYGHSALGIYRYFATGGSIRVFRTSPSTFFAPGDEILPIIPLKNNLKKLLKRGSVIVSIPQS